MKRQWLILSDGAPLARGDVLVCEAKAAEARQALGSFGPGLIAT